MDCTAEVTASSVIMLMQRRSKSQRESSQQGAHSTWL